MSHGFTLGTVEKFLFMREVLLLTLKPNREAGERWGATEFARQVASEGEGGGRG